MYSHEFDFDWHIPRLNISGSSDHFVIASNRSAYRNPGMPQFILEPTNQGESNLI